MFWWFRLVMIEGSVKLVMYCLCNLKIVFFFNIKKLLLKFFYFLRFENCDFKMIIKYD